MIGLVFVVYLFLMQHNAYFASCTFKKRFTDMKAQLTAYINNNLLSIADTTKANVPLDGFMKEFSSTLRNENYSSIAAGIFPTLGILGTFISIAITMPDFSSQTANALEREISQLLGGVGTAFYVSIYGIFLSIWWIFFEKSGMSRFEKDVRLIKMETRALFWEKEEIEQTYFQKSMENFEKLNSVFDNIGSQEFIENMNRTLEQRMMIFDAVIKREQQAVERASRQIRRGADEMEELIRYREDMLSANNEVIESMQLFIARLEENTKELALTSTTLENSRVSVADVTQHLDENVVKLNHALSHLNTENIQNIYSGVIENMDAMKSKIDSIGSAFDSHLDQFDEVFLVKIKKTLEMIDSETTQIVSQLSELKRDEEV
ncbi:MAG: hypothetical protein DRG24_04245 [Epsilonproteobacteria bacterium]|nr:MAG: hypothetical protein DRG24_04245 [Campylobacterota bacterium]